jgi:4-hydroxythreonine-4-phosphate dehydrogenase
MIRGIRIGLTMGDPAGVGPELCLAALQDIEENDGPCIPVVFGDATILQRVAAKLGLVLPVLDVLSISDVQKRLTIEGPTLIDVKSLVDPDFRPGTVSAATGDAAFSYLDHAIACAQAGTIDGIVTAPLHKEALAMAGHDFPGHTEILADRTGTDRYCMMLTSREITCSLVTTHIGLNEVCTSISTSKIVEVARLTCQAMGRMLGREPRLAICGLNPHAGENGLFGANEERDIIQPAIAELAGEGIQAIGPLPADTAFIPAIRAKVDAYICMYHDQGLIPLKTLAFDEAVNVTLGLPFVRTSVDHGTALDIAWTGQVNTRSMLEAVLLAAKMSAAAPPRV